MCCSVVRKRDKGVLVLFTEVQVIVEDIIIIINMIFFTMS